MDRRVFASGMAILASVYEKFERVVNDETLSESWYRMLFDLTNEQFIYAVEVLVKTSKFAPTIAEIREKALEYGREDELSSEEAWMVVYEDVHRYGIYNEPHYEDWKLECAKNAIGWQTLCDMTEETKGVVRAHFMRMYDSFKNRQKQLELTNNPTLERTILQLLKRLEGGSKKLPERREEKKCL